MTILLNFVKLVYHTVVLGFKLSELIQYDSTSVNALKIYNSLRSMYIPSQNVAVNGTHVKYEQPSHSVTGST